MRLRSRDLFQTVRTEGGLLPADLLQRVADGDSDARRPEPADYHLAPGERLNEAITRSWTRLAGAWARVRRGARQRSPAGDAGGRLTRERWLLSCSTSSATAGSCSSPAIEIEGKSYPVFTPVAAHARSTSSAAASRSTAAPPGVAGAAGQSPHSLVQELLNRSDRAALGDRLQRPRRCACCATTSRSPARRTSSSTSRRCSTARSTPTSSLLWLVCHQSRVEADTPEECWLERWTQDAADAGRHARARRAPRRRRGGDRDPRRRLPRPPRQPRAARRAPRRRRSTRRTTTASSCASSTGCCSSSSPRTATRCSTRAPTRSPASATRPTTRPAGCARSPTRRRGGRQHDRYEQLKLVMAALGTRRLPAARAAGARQLPLVARRDRPARRRADSPTTTCSTRSARSRRVEDGGVRRAVDFRNLGAEELGSVYESLLELHPDARPRRRRPSRSTTAAGHERKTTGSYYTPTTLISSLLDSALDPVLDEAAAQPTTPRPRSSTLAVVDPACGSGHFLIAAAHRIAKRLAAVRSERPRAVARRGPRRAARRRRPLHLRRRRQPDGRRAVQGLPLDGGARARPAALLPRPPHRARQQPARHHARAPRRRHPRRGVQADRSATTRRSSPSCASATRRSCAGQLALDVAAATADADARALAERERRDRRRRRPLARRRPRAAAPLRAAARLAGASPSAARRRRLVRRVRRRQAARRRADHPGHARRARSRAAASLSPSELAVVERARDGVRVPALARRVPRRLGARRVRRRARQPAVGARQAPGEGVLRRSVARDRRRAEQGRARAADRGARRGRPSAARRVRGRQARGRGREPLHPRRAGATRSAAAATSTPTRSSPS